MRRPSVTPRPPAPRRARRWPLVAPAWVVRRRRARTARRRRAGLAAPDRPGHARRLHRPRLRPVPGPDPVGDGHLVEEVALLRRRHLHLRRLARLPLAAQPEPHLGRHPGRPRLAAAADRPRPAGVVPAAVPALQGRLQDLARRRPAATPRRPPRAPPRPTRTPPTRWRTASGRAARSGTTSRASTSATPTAASPRWSSCPLGDPHQGAGLRRRLLLQRQLGHQDARRRARPAARPVRAARPHLDRPLGRRRQHLDDVHPRGRLASRVAG